MSPIEARAIQIRSNLDSFGIQIGQPKYKIVLFVNDVIVLMEISSIYSNFIKYYL